MPPPSNLPLSFDRDRAVRQLDARLEELLEKLKKYRPSEDPWIVRRAYEIASERHHDQFRSSGEPYVSHLLEVAHILADMRLDAITLTAAILHDAIEDTEYPVSRIEERSGPEVAHLVAGRHENRAAEYYGAGSAPGRERPQDVAGDGDGRARRVGQACRPPAQHAHAAIPGAGQAAAHLPGDSGHLRPDRAPPGNERGARGARGFVVPLSRGGSILCAAKGNQRQSGVSQRISG